MWRLIENTVRPTFMTAARRAFLPTRISPLLVNPTTDGVSRSPRLFGTTTGPLRSMTATTELVVPRSIPTMRPMGVLLSLPLRGGPYGRTPNFKSFDYYTPQPLSLHGSVDPCKRPP